jgi:hypothetical protein
MAERNTRVRGNQIKSDTVEPSDLDATNSPANGQVPAYDSGTGDFTWVTKAGLFEIDGSGDLQPVTTANTDEYYELDGNDDIMPKSA